MKYTVLLQYTYIILYHLLSSYTYTHRYIYIYIHTYIAAITIGRWHPLTQVCRHLHRSLSGLVLVGSRRPWPDPRDPGAADDANHGAALRGDQRLPGDRGCDQAWGV